VDSGNLAIQGQTRLTTIRQIDPIRVGLALAGRDLPRLQQAQARGKIPIQVLASGATDSEASPGEVEFLESTIDSVTGTIRVYGVVSNANQRLWPGQFVTVKLKIGEQGNAPVVVPNAVQIGAEGPFVFVIGPDQVAHVKRVVLGDLGEGWIWVKEGLKGSEQVVTEGQVNLVEGTKVSIVRGDTSL
jgi:RND family efflux transporter MFP subunit